MPPAAEEGQVFGGEVLTGPVDSPWLPTCGAVTPADRCRYDDSGCLTGRIG
jgi:hypothetical protein